MLGRYCRKVCRGSHYTGDSVCSSPKEEVVFLWGYKSDNNPLVMRPAYLRNLFLRFRETCKTQMSDLFCLDTGCHPEPGWRREILALRVKEILS